MVSGVVVVVVKAVVAKVAKVVVVVTTFIFNWILGCIFIFLCLLLLFLCGIRRSYENWNWTYIY